MNRVAPSKGTWPEFVMVWLERFTLAILALIFWNWVLNNGLHLDGHYRLALGLVLLGVSYGAGHTVYLEAQKSKGITPPTETAQPTATNTPPKDISKEPVQRLPAGSDAKEEKMKKDDLPKKPPSRTGDITVGPNSPISGSTLNTGTITYGPKPLVLTEEQIGTARQYLQDSPSNVRLVLPSHIANMADDRTTPLGNQVLRLLAGWSIQTITLGGAPVPPGITIVGRDGSDLVKLVVQAFEAAKIPYKLDPNGYTGPLSLGPAPLTITVSRDPQ